MDTKRLFLALVFVTVGGFGSTSANAQQVYCEMVTAAIGAGVGYGAAASVGGAIQAMSVAAGGAGGSASMAGKCERSLEEFAEYYQLNPINGDDFVRDQCGGNPLNCPGNLNPHDPWARNPWECSTLVGCAFPGVRGPLGGPFTSISVNDLLDAVTFVGISVNNGYWATDQFGYLVGIDGPVNELP